MNLVIKIYLDRNVDLKDLNRQIQSSVAVGIVRVELIQYPFEGKNKKIKEVCLPAGEMTWKDHKYMTWDENKNSWDDFKPTNNYEQIVRIVGKRNRGDCIHLDVAVKNNCYFYLTSDNDILRHREELQTLLQPLKIYNPQGPRGMEEVIQALKSYHMLGI